MLTKDPKDALNNKPANSLNKLIYKCLQVKLSELSLCGLTKATY